MDRFLFVSLSISSLSLSLSSLSLTLRSTRGEILCKQRAADRTPTIVQGGARGLTWAARRPTPSPPPRPRLASSTTAWPFASCYCASCVHDAGNRRFFGYRLLPTPRLSALCPDHSCINSRALAVVVFPLSFNEEMPGVGSSSGVVHLAMRAALKALIACTKQKLNR
uniref:Secreted protein n=1 Tax=Plectus sambesii TaxID=2011161 RepID=A0A914UYX1_9BILA